MAREGGRLKNMKQGLEQLQTKQRKRILESRFSYPSWGSTRFDSIFR